MTALNDLRLISKEDEKINDAYKRKALENMSLNDFIKDLERKDSKIYPHFNEPEILLGALKELRDDLIGQPNFKNEILRIIKAFVASKQRGIYDEKDLKHCLLYGGPGIGKTMACRILCKVFVGLGFIGAKKGQTKFASFNKLQDELLRRQKIKIRAYESKNKRVMQRINATDKAVIHAKNCLKLLVAAPHPSTHQLINEITKIIEIIESTNVELEELISDKTTALGGMEVEADKTMAKTKGDPDLPFTELNTNDVVSRYVGDTAHLCTKTMEQCRGGVAYFDEAYNICNDSRGFTDSYGRTALTIINRYMSDYPDELIVVFSGYKADIERNLFRVQEGLASRFTYKFQMEKYTGDELTQIYIIALAKNKWRIENTPQLRKIITDNIRLFKYQGRDMYSLSTYTKNIMAEKIYPDLIVGKKVSDVITDMEIVKQAIETFKEVRGTRDDDEEDTRSDLEILLDRARVT